MLNVYQCDDVTLSDYCVKYKHSNQRISIQNMFDDIEEIFCISKLKTADYIMKWLEYINI